MGIRRQAFDNNQPDPYINHDKRCNYPAEDYDGINYCWGFACAVDKGTVDTFIKQSCLKCEFWKEN